MSPLFPWLQQRSAGVLLHPSSLPSAQGIGNFGPEARRWVDFLSASGMRYWQMCPLGPTGYGDSPYQSFSSFAGNPYFIDLQPLVAYGLLSRRDLTPLHKLPHVQVDYGGLYEAFWPIMGKACAAFAQNAEGLPGYGDFSDFCAEQSWWLDAYAAFMACKTHFSGAAWTQWPRSLRSYSGFCDSPLRIDLEAEQAAVKFTQYLFFNQWQDLRAYAAERQVGLIGDVPIFVAFDSADVWAYPHLFQLKPDGQPKAVAGVPPDYFSPLGQLWGNPLYAWKKHQEDGYAWWLQRLQANMALYDIVRLDHFRGFDAYWSVPAKDKDARGGRWMPGPGLDFFTAVKGAMPDVRLIAEDLGEITDSVRELLAATGLPGMSILQFAFGGDSNNPYLPHQAIPNSVVYPGVHDNDTTLGWYQSTDTRTKDHFRRYLGVDGTVPQWDCIRAAYRSVARLAVLPLQDLLNLGSEARMNLPGEAVGNWQWRYLPQQLDKLETESAEYLRNLGQLYHRL